MAKGGKLRKKGGKQADESRKYHLIQATKWLFASRVGKSGGAQRETKRRVEKSGRLEKKAARCNDCLPGGFGYFQKSLFLWKNFQAMNTAADIPKKPVNTTTAPAKGRKIPAYLVRETIDGIPFYYLGYRQVLNKTKTIEEIMSDSGLQFFLKDYLSDLLKAGLDKKKYRIGAGELGFHPDYRNNMGLDVVVFDRKVLTPDKITTKFVTVPAKFVLEVDVNVELPDRNSDLFQEYVVRKVRRLFTFGTEKVVWVFTKSKTVISATSDAPWQFYEWDKDIELLDGVVMNIGAYIKAEGFNPDINAGR